MARLIGIVTTSRSDFGCTLRLARAIEADPALDLILYAGGMHFSRVHGYSVDEIRAAGFGAALVELPCFDGEDDAESLSRGMGRTIADLGRAFARRRPDILVLMGDRFDMIPAALAAMPFTIPIAHLSGGEVTEGVVDDAVRHAVSKLAHLHFPTQDICAERLRQLGEEDWRIVTSGAPVLDGIDEIPVVAKDLAFADVGLAPERPVTMLTYHPDTLEAANTGKGMRAILAAADRIDTQIIFTYPNADAGSREIITAIDAYCARRSDCRAVASLGRNRYFNLLRHVDCMVGNSSSGLIEAPHFGLPAVDIGERQRGRVAAANVIHTEPTEAAVEAAWRRALDPAVKAALAGMVNPYGDGHAVARVLARLKDVTLDRALLVKRFVDMPVGEAS
ncbi:MAG: UDP-N-acetylglucosamine 2-epimerase (hydrolyzing) [Rhodospirillaceae bacterium]|nr:UDP-N-acetylglucosamine 2-epimerase (hydrolyzing) [Rhodospirillales bacterium]